MVENLVHGREGDGTVDSRYGLEEVAARDEEERYTRLGSDEFYGNPSPAVGAGVSELGIIPRHPHDNRGQSKRRTISANVLLSGGGAGTIAIEGPRPGYDWLIERIFVNGGAGTCDIYVGNIQPEEQVAFFANALKASSDANSLIYCPQGAPINLVFAGGTPNLVAIANIQIRELPRYTDLPGE